MTCQLIKSDCKTCLGTGNDPGGRPLCRECEAQYRDCCSAEKTALQRDAERYRWLRDKGDSTWTSLCARSGFDADTVDAILDGAIEASGG